MSFEIITSDYFDTEAKALAKRYKSFKKDLIECKHSINSPFHSKNVILLL